MPAARTKAIPPPAAGRAEAELDGFEGWAQTMTPGTLAQHVGGIAENIRSASRIEREVLLGEASLRLQAIDLVLNPRPLEPPGRDDLLLQLVQGSELPGDDSDAINELERQMTENERGDA
jgi:hypothetical protein